MILQALRDRLPVEQTVNFAAQLTLLLKGVFYDGWKPAEVPVKMDEEQFLNRVQAKFQYSIESDMPELVDKVLNVIMDEIDEGERQDLIQVLPEDLAKYVRE